MSQYSYNLQDTIPDHTITEEWQNLVAQQARALDVMLRSLHTNLDALRNCSELSTRQKATQLEMLAQATVKGLGGLAVKLVSVEQQLAQIMGQGAAPKVLPQEHLTLIQILEQVISTLHANLTAARQALLTMLEDSSSGREETAD